MWGDPLTGAPLADGPVVSVEGVPVLLPDARRFVARHSPAWRPRSPYAMVPADPLPIDAPDPLTPHLAPGEWPEALLPPGAFGQWVRGLGRHCPDAVCAEWASELAPDGLAVDAGCGVGGMARRMAERRACVLAFDRSPRAVLLARDLLSATLSPVAIPAARGRLIEFDWPHPAVPEGVVSWAVGDVLHPPLVDGSVAWLHLGAVVDMVPSGVDDVLEAIVGCLMPGGLLTLATPHDEDAVPTPDGPDPGEVVRAVLHELGLHLVDEAPEVPWVVRQYDRGYRVLLTDCLAARAPA